MKCPHCQKPAAVVYEDSVCYVAIPPDATVAGHMQIIPKKHYENIEEVPEDVAIQLFYVASYAASAAYERLGCQGTNILCNNGNAHVLINVLPRKENDGINFQWQAKQLQPADFDDIVKKIKDKTDYIGIKKEEIKQESVEQISEEKSQQEKPQEMPKEEENYMIKHLYRIP
jgi:histidine triad (HIT) family protein